MKLRNKKTGDIAVGYVMVGIQNNEKYPNPIEYHTYGSIAELNEVWEDYKPTDPLIEDEKARNVFREWAELIGAEHFKVNHFFNSKGYITLIRSTDLTTEPSIELPGHIGKDLETYNQIELCGEEEK